MSSIIPRVESKYAVSPGGHKLEWVDAFDLHLSGLAWQNEKHYRRLSNSVQDKLSENLARLSSYSAGASIYFETNSPSLSIHWQHKGFLKNAGTNNICSYGLDLYLFENDKWRFVTAGASHEIENYLEIMAFMEQRPRKYCLHLPLFTEIELLRIGIDVGSDLQKIMPYKDKPLLFYGTSIVHGSAASRPGMTYPAQISRALKRTHYNFGFASNGRMDPIIGQCISELDVDLIMVDPIPNMSIDTIEKNAYIFMKHILERKNKIPVVMVSCFPYSTYGFYRSTTKAFDVCNPAFLKIFERLKNEGHENLHYFVANNMIGDDFEGTMDGTHPNDLGFYRITQNMVPYLTKLLRYT